MVAATISGLACNMRSFAPFASISITGGVGGDGSFAARGGDRSGAGLGGRGDDRRGLGGLVHPITSAGMPIRIAKAAVARPSRRAQCRSYGCLKQAIAAKVAFNSSCPGRARRAIPIQRTLAASPNRAQRPPAIATKQHRRCSTEKMAAPQEVVEWR